jgi:oligosaccharide repeat unit polymerase
MGYILSAVVLIIIALCIAILFHISLFSPFVISALAWLLSFFPALFFYEDFYPLTGNVFFLWLIWFTVTSIVFFFFYFYEKKNTWQETEVRKLPLDYSVAILILIAWLGYKTWVIGNTGPGHFFFNLRLSAINADDISSIGLLERFYPLVFALFLFEHVYEREENRRLRFLLWCWMLLYAVAIMGKLSLLTPFVSWAIIKDVKGKLKIKKFIILVPVVFVLIMAMHFIRRAGTFSIRDVLAIYTYSPLVALDYINVDNSLPIGAYVLRFLYAVGYRLGITLVQPINVISSFIEVPKPTNTFTVIYPFYFDFGLLGVILGALFYGLFFSFLYLFSIKGRRMALTLYSGYSIALFLQFFGEFFIFFFSLNLQIFIWVVLIYLVSRRVNYVC